MDLHLAVTVIQDLSQQAPLIKTFLEQPFSKYVEILVAMAHRVTVEVTLKAVVIMAV